MRANERNIIIGVVGLVIVLAFWFMILGPKRNEASELGTQVAELETAVDAAEQQADFAKQARREFPANYAKLVVLGKAVPQNGDSASFLVQLNTIAEKTGVDFRSLILNDEDTGAPAPAPTQPGVQNAPPSTSQPSTEQPGQAATAATDTSAPASSTGTTASTTGSTGSAAPPATTTAAPATEATAATLAIGSGIGPAGLSTLKYSLKFTGDFFKVADFIEKLNKLIETNNGKIVVDGRLTTIDGFALTGDPDLGFPHLVASFEVTSYLAPADQGLTGGATPSGPPATIPGQPDLQPASTGTAP